jgi:hypothetical protein
MSPLLLSENTHSMFLLERSFAEDCVVPPDIDIQARLLYRNTTAFHENTVRWKSVRDGGIFLADRLEAHDEKTL